MSGRVRSVWALVVVLLAACANAPDNSAVVRPVAAADSAREEFVGPFPSWTNLKTQYGAVGDGQTDDTAALRRALAELGKSGRSPVLYVPAGHYRITDTLTLSHEIWLGVIGEDPDSTSFEWDGPRGGTMLVVNGIAYSRINRLTFDGRRTAAVAVEQSFDNVGQHFDTGNEYADDVFRDVEFGIHGGFKGFGFAETSIVRARFLRNTTAGVALGNFNALDIWIWYSLFEDCATGVTNNPGAGNYRVYGSVFRRSRIADLSMQNTGGFSARGNYSAGSRAFFVSGPTINHPASVELQGNTIVDPIDTMAIRLGNQGPGVLLDNAVRSRSGAQAAVVWWKSFFHGADVLTAGNAFTVSTPFDINGRHVSVDDRTVLPADIAADEPTLPATLRNDRRDVLEVPRTADAAAIQALVNDAAKRTNDRAVVHVPWGEYAIDRTIVVPPSGMQIVGDGCRSILRWSGSGRGPVVAIDGPTRVSVRDLCINGSGTADGMIVANIDQAGARVYMEGVQVNAAAETGLHVDRVSEAAVDLVDIGHGYTPSVSVKVTRARATVYSGASAGNALSYEVSDGGDLLVGDVWYEGDTAVGFARVRGSARLTMRGMRVAVPADRPVPAFDIANLSGAVTLLLDSIDDRIVVSGDSARGRVLGIGLTREFRTSPFFTNTGGARAVLLNGRQRVERQTMFSSGTAPMADVGDADAGFLRAMLERTRQTLLPSRRTAVPDGATDLELHRVVVNNARKDLIVTGQTRDDLRETR